MKSFLSALQFLTVIPVRIKDVNEKKLAKSMVYFPVVGLLLGLGLAGINKFLFFLKFPQPSTNIILIISLVFLTGGIHQDGLSDTFDALLSGKGKEEMLRIMRDSHAGVMGILAIISILFLKIAFLNAISLSLKTISLLLMCTLSRWSLVLSMFLFPYAREEGKAKVFMQGINKNIFILSTIITLACVIVAWKIKGLLILLIIAAFAYLFAKSISKKLNGVTGDTLGATNEMAELIVLIIVCILERINIWIT